MTSFRRAKWFGIVAIAGAIAGAACSSASDVSSDGDGGGDDGSGGDASGNVGADATTSDATAYDATAYDATTKSDAATTNDATTNDATTSDAASPNDSGGGATDAGAVDAEVDSGPVGTIVVSPSNATVAAGFSQAYSAKLVFPDGGSIDVTAIVVWSTSDAGGATISNDGGDGLATGVSMGMVSVTATDPSTSLSGAAMLTIDGTFITNMIVSPSPGFVAPGAKLQFKATGTFSDTSMRDVTRDMQWTTGDAAAATIDTHGVATGIMQGITSVEAQNPKVVPDTVALYVR